MGSGKSTLGKKLAFKLGYSFIDMDAFIEQQEGFSIADIFAGSGEDHFRLLERKALLTLLNMENVVVATGGGTPCFFDNIEMINQEAFSIYLKVDIEKLIGRLKIAADKRPLVAALNASELDLDVRKRLAVREPFYNKAKLVFSSHGSPHLDAEIIKDLILQSK